VIEKLLKKHAKKYVTSERHDGKLEGIHYHDNGNIYVTDAHQLLCIKDAHQSESYTKHYKTGKKMNINYPKVERLLDSDYKGFINLNMKELKSYIPLIKIASQIELVGSLTVKNSQLILSTKSLELETFRLVLGDTDNDLKISLNLMYFYYMLNFFKDAKIDEIIFRFSGPFRPMSFTAENYEILIMPVRRYS